MVQWTGLSQDLRAVAHNNAVFHIPHEYLK